MSSKAAPSWSGENITPNVEMTTSKLPSWKARHSASAARGVDLEPLGLGALS
jgi:hypothetical protein